MSCQPQPRVKRVGCAAGVSAQSGDRRRNEIRSTRGHAEASDACPLRALAHPPRKDDENLAYVIRESRLFLPLGIPCGSLGFAKAKPGERDLPNRGVQRERARSAEQHRRTPAWNKIDGKHGAARVRTEGCRTAPAAAVSRHAGQCRGTRGVRGCSGNTAAALPIVPTLQAGTRVGHTAAFALVWVGISETSNSTPFSLACSKIGTTNRAGKYPHAFQLKTAVEVTPRRSAAVAWSP